MRRDARDIRRHTDDRHDPMEAALHGPRELTFTIISMTRLSVSAVSSRCSSWVLVWPRVFMISRSVIGMAIQDGVGLSISDLTPICHPIPAARPPSHAL